MPPTPYNPHTNPSIYLGGAPKPPVIPPYLKPNWNPNAQGSQPHVNYPAPPTTEFSPGANPPRPPSPVYPGGGGGGGGPAADMWNGHRVIRRAPGGNVLVDINGEAQAYDPWGNLIPHLFYGPGGGDPNGGADGQGGGAPGPAAPPAATPQVGSLPMPPGQTPQTFYAPTTGSPYLQLGGNFLSYMGDAERSQLNDTLIRGGFKPTGAMSTYGQSDYLRPAQFDENDLQALFQNDHVRQWMRFFMGNLGYGASYQLPAGYQPGSGLPTPPPMPLK